MGLLSAWLNFYMKFVSNNIIVLNDLMGSDTGYLAILIVDNGERQSQCLSPTSTHKEHTVRLVMAKLK